MLTPVALLRPPKNSPALPHYSPSLYEKSRLSPIPFSPPSLPFPQPRTLLHPGYCLDPLSSGSVSARPQYVAVVNSDTRVLHDSGGSTPPRSGCGSASRRGSKQRDWRRNSAGGSLAPVVESLRGGTTGLSERAVTQHIPRCESLQPLAVRAGSCVKVAVWLEQTAPQQIWRLEEIEWRTSWTLSSSLRDYTLCIAPTFNQTG